MNQSTQLFNKAPWLHMARSTKQLNPIYLEYKDMLHLPRWEWKPFKYRDYVLTNLWVQIGWSQWNHGRLEQYKWNLCGQGSCSLPSSPSSPTKDQGCPSSESVALEEMNRCPRAVITYNPEGTSRNVAWWGWLTLLINFALGSYAFNDFLFYVITISLLNTITCSSMSTLQFSSCFVSFLWPS